LGFYNNNKKQLQRQRGFMSLGFDASVCVSKAVRCLRQDECLPENSLLSRTTSHMQRGFTLIELLAVLVLLAIVATITTVSISDVGAEAQDDLGYIEISEIRKALQQFKRDVGHYPDAAGNHDDDARLRLLWTCQDTNAAADDYDEGCRNYNPDSKRGWHGPYLLGERNNGQTGLYDPWGSAYLLLEPDSATPSTGDARIVSAGPDRQYDGVNADPCHPNGDDIVLCLVQ
jgi:general secretion pathway protein G